MKRIAVIGGGIGGLSAALYASANGNAVDVYEKNPTVGGKAGEFVNQGFRFDTGPSLLTMPFVINNLFSDAGVSPQDFFRMEKLDILCKYFFADGTVINAYSDPAIFAAEIESATGTDRMEVHRYLRYCKQIYKVTADLFLFGNFQSIRTILSKQAFLALMQLHKIDAFRTMHQANKKFFADSRLVQMFDRYATYNGSSPYLAPATLNIIQHVEYNLGGYVINGGMRRLPEAMQKLAEEKGVRIFCNHAVEQITCEHKAVTGISVHGKNLPYDAVVANADVYSVYKQLLPANPASADAKRYAKLEPSSSALVFYWGVQGTFPDLEIHNILFSFNYKKEFDDLFTAKRCPDDATVYIYISQKFSPHDAPEGCTNWFVMINAPHHQGQDWDAEVTRCREQIQQKINSMLHINIQELIICESVLTPATLEEQTGSAFGSIYGISSNNRNAAFLRQRNRSSHYKNLYFCGGSAHPGGGVPLVILSGKTAATSIK